MQPDQNAPQGSKNRGSEGTDLVFARTVAWLALAWERFWPLILPAVGIAALFLTISWLGFWPLIPDQIRIAMLVALVVGLFGTLWFLRHFKLPLASEVDTRIERTSQLQHRPVTAQVDVRSNAAASDDPFAAALWHEHKRRMANELGNLKSGLPVPKVAKFDPFALRSLVGLMLFIAIFAGWGNLQSRIGDAFRTHSETVLLEGRIDAWVKPPSYTNRPPIFLSQRVDENSGPLNVPEGSEVVIRAAGLEDPSVVLVDGDNEIEITADEKVVDTDKPALKTAAKENSKTTHKTFKTTLDQAGSIVLRSNNKALQTWAFTVKADLDPQISFQDEPKPSLRGALEFSYTMKDDYGVTSANAEILPLSDLDGQAQPLINAPEIKLPLPRRAAKEGTVKTSQDLTNHPWAGAKVTMTLVAKDQAGQIGKSTNKEVELPERIFTKPLAEAIVFERRRLAMDKRTATNVAEMLDIITDTHPDEFIKNLSHYTALRVAYRSIRRAQNDDDLREAVELLWQTALAVEDGDLSLAEKRLRDAQERLAKALENGASNEEISKLMQELRQAMNEFMQELAEQMAKNPQNQQSMPFDQNTQILRQQDLERMMQQIEDLAKSGSKDAARQLLEEMQRMMNNLQTAQPQQNQQRNDQFSEQMDKLGEMMRQQQQLMDQTFDMQRQEQQQQQGQQNKDQQRQNGKQGEQGKRQQGGQKPMSPKEFADAMKELRRQQGELQEQMQKLQESLRDLGMEPGEKLGEAGEAMGEAEQQLGQGNNGPAAGEQSRAIQAMRQGAQQMMQQMQNQAGEQGRRGERGQHGQQSRGERDPLGRQSRSQGPQLGNDTKVPGEIDAQRAREILDAIRRKLSDPSRPKLELDYLDRLLPTR